MTTQLAARLGLASAFTAPVLGGRRFCAVRKTCNVSTSQPAAVNCANFLSHQPVSSSWPVNCKSHASTRRELLKKKMTRDAYGQAYQKGFELTIRFLLSRGLPRDTASEVAQAAWVRGWERHRQLRNDDFVVTWVNTIALNVYRSLLRNESLVNREVQQIPDRVVAIDLAAIDVGRMLRSCGSRDRILLEQYMDGFTMAEIARKHDSTETAIRIRLLRARRAARCRAQRRTVRRPRNFDVASARRKAA